MAFLLDTTALSEPLKRTPNPKFMGNLAKTAAADLYTSSVCLMELRYGCALRDNADFWKRIDRDVLSHVHILPFGPEEAVQCGEVLAHLSKTGIPIGVEDTQIGATALLHGLTIITFNKNTLREFPVSVWKHGRTDL